MTFATIDFETACNERDSACEIGLTLVEGGIVTDTKSWLVHPPDNRYDDFNVQLHGIGPRDTEHTPALDKLWPQIEEALSGRVVLAHNVGFDMSVLRRSLDYHGVEHPTLSFACSYALSKRVLPGRPSYSLDEVCFELDIELDHHRAGPDSRATAELVLRLLAISDVTTVEDLLDKHSYRMGRMSPMGYTGCLATGKSRYRSTSVTGDPSKVEEESPFYGRGVVFTGTLSSMTHTEARQLVADIGANAQTAVNGKTDYLVVGQQDYRKVGEDGMSNKQRKAIESVEAGGEIEILAEGEFLRLL